MEQNRVQKEINEYMVNYFLTKAPKLCNEERIITLGKLDIHTK